MSKFLVICVDDEKIILDSLTNELQSILSDDCVLEIAESGDEAIGVIDENAEEGIMPAVIVSDQIMPGMKGDEFLIKMHEKYPNAMKILLTGQADADAVGNVVNNAKLYRYIAKPWEKMDFRMTIQEAIKIYQSNEIIAEQEDIIEKLRVNIVENFITAKEIKLDDHQLYRRVFFQRFIRSLSSENKDWFIRACLGLINMDGKVNNSKMIFLSAIVSENRNKEFVNDILTKVKEKTIPQLENRQEKSQMALKLVQNLIIIPIENKKITVKESNYIIYLCGKLGLDKESVKKVIEFGKSEIMLNYEKHQHYLNMEDEPQIFGSLT
ncbi:MAG: response regulator [Deltaproteobacteria bacterium]|jgi:CheY-like chemotaxis protein|nr:response regulator [Deltaproteobacteria bacterium]MBT4525348.1 response regulator [Deltaproteobacteria bacterium]